MVEKEIQVTETIGITRDREYVRVGVPFRQGELDPLEGVCVVNPAGKNEPAQAKVMKRWPDGSVKWLLVDFAASVPARTKAAYRLRCGCTVHPAAPVIRIIPAAASWLVDTGAVIFSVDAHVFRPFSAVRTSGGDVLAPERSSCTLIIEGEKESEAVVDGIVAEQEGPLRVTLRLEGFFPPRQEYSPRFTCRLDFFAGSSCVMMDFTLRNHRPARHPGGLWDLGDPGSLFFRELAFLLPLAGTGAEIACCPEDGGRRVSCRRGDISVYQESSGGENWLSPAHLNKDGVVPLTFRGYEISTPDEKHYGLRATPVVWCGTGTSGLAAILPRFWEEFPKQMEVGRHRIKISLFPSRFPGLHELQGGERKTTALYLDIAASPDGLAWARAPLTVTAAPEAHYRARVVPELAAMETGGAKPELVGIFIPGPKIFLEKRETIDEYGWRNFGEIYADHEAVYHQAPEPFVSHYCNQYDICAGMYRTFLAGGEPLWGQLAADLARHVLDIDLYHTDKDREEYNGGPFWHTDHYLAAGLSTHRSFSREHLKTKDPRFCGGGPGVEHCYTTGLMLHYFLTGNADSREAVISLAEWSVRLLAGPHPVLAVLTKGKRSLAQSRETGARVRPFPRYPLTRGTGNTINACLDAFEVDGGRKFLQLAEKLIRGALHPEDDIASRDLLNAESAWSYSVLLVAVAKFLEKKGEQAEFDDGYHYARASLLAYAEWMSQHEYPYLEKPEILEYPNETWPAQDLRKSVVLYYAAKYAGPDRKEAFLHRARFFMQAATDELRRHPTSTFTRPLALILQNGWVAAALSTTPPSPGHPQTVWRPSGRRTPNLEVATALQRIGSELWRSLRQTSLRREYSWLRARIQGR